MLPKIADHQKRKVKVRQFWGSQRKIMYACQTNMKYKFKFFLKKTFSKWNKVWISQLSFCFGEFYPSYTSRQRTQYYEKVTGNYYPGWQSTKLDSLLTRELHWALMVARSLTCPTLGQRPPVKRFPTTNKACEPQSLQAVGHLQGPSLPIKEFLYSGLMGKEPTQKQQ